MTNKTVTRGAAALAAALCLAAGACAFSDGGAPPFVISQPVARAAAREGYYAFAGVEFDYHNLSAKTVTGVTVSFLILDSETGENPLGNASNAIQERYTGKISAGAVAGLVVPLDRYVHVAPGAPYRVDEFCVRRVDFSDRTFWEDPQGLYAARSGQEYHEGE